jgi:hypothetical protein
MVNHFLIIAWDGLLAVWVVQLLVFLLAYTLGLRPELFVLDHLIPLLRGIIFPRRK